MAEFTPQMEKEVVDIINSVTEEQKKQDPQFALFLIWDYLEEQEVSTHHIADYVNQNGDMLINKAMLMELIDF